MDDAETVALISGVNRLVLSQIHAQKGEGHRMPQVRHQQPHYNITHPQNQQPQYQHHAPNGFDPNINFPGANNHPSQDPYSIPSEVSMTPTTYVPLPRDAQGNEIIPPEYRHIVPQGQQPAQQVTFTQEGFKPNGFNMPDYSTAPPSASEDQFDIIIKEIKSLKKAVNKLIREMASVKLPSEPTNTSE
jgi:DNA-directed RNA polymerase subunit L